MNTMHYFGIYCFGLLLLIAYYTLDYPVAVNSGVIQDRINFVSENNAKMFKPFIGTSLGNKYFMRYKDVEQEIVFDGALDGRDIQFRNIFTNDYPEIYIHDWFKEIKYTVIIKESLTRAEIPFYVNNLSATFSVKGDKFLGAPVWPLSPQIILLLFLSPLGFIFINHILLYTIGAYGLVRLSKEYGLKFPAFGFLFILFNFNGYLIEKISAYGPGQLGYYFIPFIILYLFRLNRIKSDSENNKELYRISILLGIALALMLWQGSLHFFVQFITFLIVWVIFNITKLKYLVISFTVAFVLSAFKILPAAVAYGVAANQNHTSGYTDPVMLVKALIYTTSHLTWPQFSWWEKSLYVSIFGLIILVKFSIVDVLLKRKHVERQFKYTLYLPVIIMIVVSLWKFSEYLIPNFIPLLNSESHPARYSIVPLLMLSVFASINLSRYLEISFAINKYILYVLLILFTISLIDHTLLWRILRMQVEVAWLFENANIISPGFDVIAEKNSNILGRSIELSIDNRPNVNLYVLSFYVGVLMTLSMCVVLIYLFRVNIIMALKKYQNNLRNSDLIVIFKQIRQ